MSHLKDKDFIRFRNLIYKEIGLIFNETNQIIISSRVNNRMKSLKVNSAGDYYDYIINNETELLLFLDAVTTNLTDFFRSSSVLKIIVDYVLPSLIKMKRSLNQNRTINVWSAGCSSGEEVYTLAMLLGKKLAKDFDYKIVGTDISMTSLSKAKKGIYSSEDVKNIPLDYIEYIQSIEKDKFKITQNIMNKTSFKFKNLLDKVDTFNMDLIICLNVLIYFDNETKKRIVETFSQVCNKGGFLIVGFGDIINNQNFSQFRTDHGNIFQRI